MEPNDLKERFSAAEPSLEVGPGSLDAVKARGDQRTRRARAGGGLAAVLVFIVVGFGIFAFAADRNPSTLDVTDDNVIVDDDGEATIDNPNEENTDENAVSSGAWVTNGTLNEADFSYVGSFTTPAEIGGSEIGFGGRAAAYNPAGDGSLFIAGFPVDGLVAEISIPEFSPHEGSRTDLVESELLQPLTDITEGRAASLIGSQERGGQGQFNIGGLEVVGDRLHWTAWQVSDVVGNDVAGHGHSSLNLDEPDVQGPWFLGDFAAYETAGYVFDVPQTYADEFLDGNQLVSGFQPVLRSPLGSQGPPFFAFTPPEAEEPEARLDAIELANFEFGSAESTSFGDEAVFPGGEWVSTSDNRHAVAVVGNTLRLEANTDCTLGTETDVAAHGPQIALYDPAVLASVATGNAEPSSVEPYQIISLEADVIPTCGAQITSVSFDAANERLFVVQALATATETIFDARPVIHVFSIG